MKETVEIVNAITDQAGIDEKFTPEIEAEIERYFIPASIVGFSDGEITMRHPSFNEPRLKNLYGKDYFHDGQVARKLREAAILNGMKPNLLTSFQRTMAHLYVNNPRQGSFLQKQTSSGVSIHDTHLIVDNNYVPLNKRPEIVVDYGAGLAGLFHIQEQIKMVKSNQSPYRYIASTRLPFTNSVLLNSYNYYYGKEILNEIINNQYYIGREDGIKKTSELLLQSQKINNAWLADIVIASAIDSAEEQEVEAGIKNSFHILKNGGALVIRSLVHPRENEIGAKNMLKWAKEAGYDDKKIDTFTTWTGGAAIKSVFNEEKRESIAAILFK